MLLDTINSLSMGYETFTCHLSVYIVNCKFSTVDSYMMYCLLSSAFFLHLQTFISFLKCTTMDFFNYSLFQIVI